MITAVCSLWPTSLQFLPHWKKLFVFRFSSFCRGKSEFAPVRLNDTWACGWREVVTTAVWCRGEGVIIFSEYNNTRIIAVKATFSRVGKKWWVFVSFCPWLLCRHLTHFFFFFCIALHKLKFKLFFLSFCLQSLCMCMQPGVFALLPFRRRPLGQCRSGSLASPDLLSAPSRPSDAGWTVPWARFLP